MGEEAAKEGEGFRYAPETRADAIPFQEFCERVFEKMRGASTGNAKIDLLEPFLAKLGSESCFPLMRLILPELDNMRDKYGLKTAKLAKLIASMYFSDKDKRYTQLVLHTDPVKNPSPEKDWQITGDFPLTLQYVLQHAPNLEVVDKTTWTLGQVNSTLDDLARATNDAKRGEVLRRIRVDCSPMNQKWIVRIILKNLKIKVKKDRVLKRIHPDALDEYSRTTSLRKVCTSFIGVPSSMRARSNVEVFMSFSPMLATNFFYRMDKIMPSFAGRPFCMDIKLDGERMLCHRTGDKIKWFTRNAKDYSARYGPVLDPHVLAGVGASKCILDGEVVTWDDQKGGMVPFGYNRTYAREELEGAGNGTRWLFYVVFDIIYAAGDGPEEDESMRGVISEAARASRAPCAPGTTLKAGNLTALPLDVRRRVLRSLLTEQRHRLELVKNEHVEAGDEASRKEKLANYFERAILLGEEGLVVKDLSGNYQIGSKSRLSNLWIKMKPEYSGETDDLDLIILAAGYAHGKMRAGLLSKFLVGVAVPTLDGSPPTKFYAISRVATGISMEKLAELNERLSSKWKDFDTLPCHFDSAGVSKKCAGRDGMKVTRWIAPEDSICLEVKCSEIVKSNDWPGLACTLRFPRVSRVRFDKGAEGCMDTTQLAELQSRPRKGASASGSGGGGSGDGGRGGKRRKWAGGKGTVRAGGRHVSGLFHMGGGDGVSVKESVFTASGTELEMCVVGDRFWRPPHEVDVGIDEDAWWRGTVGSKRKAGDAVLSRSQMGDLIRENGGALTAHPGKKTSFVVVCGNGVQVKNVIAAGMYNVADYRWVLDCIDKKIYDFPPMRYLRAAQPEIRKLLSQTKDEHGDDYTEPTDAKSLSQLLLNVQAPARPPEEADSWLSPLNEVDEQDMATLMDSSDFVFADPSRCLVYCDMFQNLGSEDPPGIAKGSGQSAASTVEEVPFNVLGSTAAVIRLYGGDVAHSLHVGVTHVVMDPQDTARHMPIKERLRKLHKRPDSVFNIRIVTPAWAWRCVDLGRLEPPHNEDIVVLV